jgi:hypothetical protein
MDDDVLLRDALRDHICDEPPMRTGLDTVLPAARRARARRQILTAVAGGVGAIAVLTAGLAATRSDHDSLQPPPVAGTHNSPADATRALIESRVRADLPGGQALVRQTIYPSDWNRSTELPPADALNATDWHGKFTVPGHPDSELWLSVFVNPPDSNPTEADLRAGCRTITPVCRVDRLGPGSLLLTQVTDGTGGVWTRTLLHFRPGDRAVNAREKVKARTYAEALAKWVYTPAQLAALAKDPSLIIPQPVQRPPLPAQR